MVRAEFPEYPMFHSLRLASASDVGRMAELSVLGFKDSEIFKYERPNYDEYPQDTLAGVRNMYRSQLLHPRAVVIVAEDCYCDDEVASEYQFSAGNKVNKLSKRVVVGVASWFLPDGSPRTGQFVVPDVGKLEPTKDRDLSKHRLKVFTAISDVIESKYFTGKTVCNKLVVHPCYRRRGHATAMLNWGLRLCDLDDVDQGVIPSHMGQRVYAGLGYRIIGEMTIPDDGDVKGFTQRVVLYTARRRENVDGA